MGKKEIVEKWMTQLQDEICRDLEKLDGGNFKEDLWERPGGGGGRTRIIQGNFIEKGGVNFSAVHGPLPSKIQKALNLKAQGFFATGVSIVLHAKNPWVPIIHMNVRYFETSDGMHWFGGGIDLTPIYIIPEEAVHFHRQLKNICDDFHPEYYPKFKIWADQYFTIKHRDETRGIGGIFFDRISENHEFSWSDRWRFVQAVGNGFIPAYTFHLENNRYKDYGEPELEWQCHRRGRYVEFNLVWDRGTKFGLDTEGRTESILMSLPPIAQWSYQHNYLEDKHAVLTQNILKSRGVDWVR